MNPITDDLASKFFQRKNKPRRDTTPRRSDRVITEPTETYEDRDQHYYNLRNIYGPQNEPETWREGRRIR